MPVVRAATLIISDDEFLASEALDAVRREADELGYAREEIEAGDHGALLYALGTPSLFDAGRLIVVRNAHDLGTESVELIARWAADPSHEIALALVASGAKADKIAKGFGKPVHVVKALAPAPWDTAKWLAARVRAHGRKISTDGAQAIVDSVGTDLRELAAASDQLLLDVDGAIDVEIVRSRFHGLESKVYEFVDAVLDRDQPQALMRLRSLIENGENAIGIVTQLARQLRVVAAVKDGPRLPPEALARELGARPGQVKRAFRQARNFDAADIRRAYRLVADTDLALKSETQDDLILDLLVEEITRR
jgi:DNA polymerase-3 subunit delta